MPLWAGEDLTSIRWRWTVKRWSLILYVKKCEKLDPWNRSFECWIQQSHGADSNMYIYIYYDMMYVYMYIYVHIHTWYMLHIVFFKRQIVNIYSYEEYTLVDTCVPTTNEMHGLAGFKLSKWKITLPPELWGTTITKVKLLSSRTHQDGRCEAKHGWQRWNLSDWHWMFCWVRMTSVVRCYTKLPWMICIPLSWALNLCTNTMAWMPHSSPSDEVGDAEDRKLFHT